MNNQTPTTPGADERPHRIEIKTLVHELDEFSFGDAELAGALNAGWEILNLTVTTHVDDFTDHPKVIHTRIVTLMRLVEDEGAPDAAKAEAEAPELAHAADVITPPDGVEAVIEQLMEPAGELLEPVGDVSRIHDAYDPLPQRIVGVNVTYAEAVMSGRYTNAELHAIALREVQEAGLDAYASWQPQINPATGEAWEGLKFEHLSHNLMVLSDGG